MKNNSYIISILVILFLGVLGLVISQNNKDNETNVAVEPTYQEQVVDFSNPERYYLYQLYQYDREFKDIGLYSILGPEKDKVFYVIDSNQKTQEHMDKLLYGYCTVTSGLFHNVTSYMKEDGNYDSSIFNVLYNIIYRQQEVLDRYGSSKIKEDANVNTFKYEQECVDSLNPVRESDDISRLLTKIRNI